MSVASEAETILKMIETVDPADTAKLDEIDCRVYCYIETPDYEFVGIDYGRKYIYAFREGTRRGRSSDFREVPYYTRSRDALKAVRPKGWIPRGDREGYEIAEFCYGWQFCLILLPDTPIGSRVNETRIIGNGRTEELAELHAIVQAIEYERRSGATNP